LVLPHNGSAASCADTSFRLSVTPSGELLFGRFDFVHTLRAIVNLLENAVRYSPPDSAVDLTVHREGDQLVIAVGDRGPGIKEADPERVFESFIGERIREGWALDFRSRVAS
jgi:two-component system sensor histidine kinase KdpD